MIRVKLGRTAHQRVIHAWRWPFENCYMLVCDGARSAKTEHILLGTGQPYCKTCKSTLAAERDTANLLLAAMEESP